MTARVATALMMLLPVVGGTAPPKTRLEPSSALNEPGKTKVTDEAQTIANRAITAFRKGDLALAKKDFQKVLELAPDNVATMINLGLIAQRRGEVVEAERLLNKAVRIAPDAGTAWLVLGVVRYDARKLDGALAALTQAVWLEPKDARAHHYLGATLGGKGWYSGAEEEMRKAIELEPEYADAQFNLALLYLQRIPPAVELARRHYYKALELGAAADAEIEKKLGQSVENEKTPDR
jgi:Flp pilus assembly protein TadD